jgi:hypothetical protein
MSQTVAGLFGVHARNSSIELMVICDIHDK